MLFIKNLFLSYEKNGVNIIFSNVKLEKLLHDVIVVSSSGDVVSMFKNLKLEFSQINGNTYFYNIISCD